MTLPWGLNLETKCPCLRMENTGPPSGTRDMQPAQGALTGVGGAGDQTAPKETTCKKGMWPCLAV